MCTGCVCGRPQSTDFTVAEFEVSLQNPATQEFSQVSFWWVTSRPRWCPGSGLHATSRPRWCPGSDLHTIWYIECFPQIRSRTALGSIDICPWSLLPKPICHLPSSSSGVKALNGLPSAIEPLYKVLSYSLSSSRNPSHYLLGPLFEISERLNGRNIISIQLCGGLSVR